MNDSAKLPKLESAKESAKTMQETSSTVETPKLVVPPTAEMVEKHEPKQKRKYTRRQVQEPREALVPSPAEQINLDLLKKSIVAITASIDNFAVRGIYNKAKRITQDENLSKEIATGVGITKPEMEVVSEATTVIFARSEMLMRHAPEVMLAAVAVSYTARFLIAMGRLDAIEKELKKAHKGKEKSEDNNG